MLIISGKSIATQLKLWGVPCDFEKLSVAPQLIKYKFRLNDPLFYQKAKKISEPLSIWAGAKAEVELCEKGFCVQIERKERGRVSLNEYADALTDAPPFSVAIGTTTDDEQRLATLDELTHLLVAGTTGSGKSVALSNIITSLCCFNSKKNLALFLIDVKNVEFSKFKRAPQVRKVITDSAEAKDSLEQLVQVMETRYAKLAQIGATKNCGHFAKIVVAIDELADLILQEPATKGLIIRLLQKARASGIHLVLGTQSPRASILDGLLLANLPSRLALKCSSARESVLVLGHKGAEELLGKGDALFKLPSSTKEERIQCPFLSSFETNSLKFKS